MANALQLRRGTTTQHNTFTGLAGEVTVDTDKDTVVVHDGSTAGGFPLAKTADIATEVAALVDSAPSTLDTLNELAAALGDDPNFATTVTNSIATKMPLAGGTFTGNVTFDDNDKAIFGAGNDLQIYHDGSNSYINDAGTGDLRIQANGALDINKYTGENMARFYVDGAVQLYFNNALKLATTSIGADVRGNGTSEVILGVDTNFNDKGNYRIRVTEGATYGTMYFEDFAGANWSPNLALQSNGEVYFYEDGGNAVKFYWDSVNEATVHKDGVKASFGDSSDLQIYHDASDSYVYDVGSGNLNIATNGGQVSIQKGTSENMAIFAVDGAVTLYYDNAAKIATTTSGVNITGTAYTNGVTVDGTLDIEEVYEKVALDGSTSGTINFDTTTQGIEYYVNNQTANRTINFSNVGANLSTGQSLTCTLLMDQGSTAYYLNAYQVDGGAVTPRWSGGSAPTGGNASGIDVYTFTIIRTGSNTYTVLASQSQYA